MIYESSLSKSPSLSSNLTWKIRIKDLNLQAFIGIYPHEKEKQQPIRINLICDIDLPDPINKEGPLKYVCYGQLIKIIEQLVSSQHFDLVETLVEQIAALILQDKRIGKIWVYVEKLRAFKNVGSVGIEIVRYQGE